jgi:hypothetical protein
MTPRQADLAFLLEDVEGVLEVYAIDPGQRAAEHFDFAVRLTAGGRALAVVPYALLQILTHAECTRVFFFADRRPAVVAQAVRRIVLSGPEREEARRRAAARPAPEPVHEIRSLVSTPEPVLLVLVVDDDPQVEATVEAVIAAPAVAFAVDSVAGALTAAQRRAPDLVLCAARFAFGQRGLLAQLPLAIARKVLVLAHPAEVVDARWRLQGTERILVKPVEDWLICNRIENAWATSQLSAPDHERVIGSSPPTARLTTPHPGAPFSALVVDLDEEIHEQLRWCFRGEARHVLRRDPEEAAALALSTPFHLVAISANAALHPTRSFLDAVARADRTGVDRVLVFAPARDVPYVKHKLALAKRRNLVLAVPIDDATLRREIFRAHPALEARVAVEEVLGAATGAPEPGATTEDVRAPKPARPRYRRPAVLIVDDDPTTAILFASSGAREDADVAYAPTPMAAFEHVLERPVDVLVVSATLRGDGGEPFYRVLWRLKPELKGRCVLVTAADAAPSSSRHVVARPLTRDAVGRIVRAFAMD